MKKNFIHNSIKSFFSKEVISIIIVSAVVPCISLADSGALDNPLKAKTFGELINSILDLILSLGTPIIIFFFIYAGFEFVTSRGDPKKLDTAKSMFWWTVIGAFIIVGARVILSILSNTIGGITN